MNMSDQAISTFLNRWYELFGSQPVTSIMLTGLFQQAQPEAGFSSLSRRQQTSTINRFLWRHKDEEQDGMVIRLVDQSKTGYPLQYYLESVEDPA
jgi:hypothetical protein